MKRILVLTNMYPPHHYGGYELVCQEAVLDLRRRGHEVEVLTSDLRLPEREQLDDEREAHRQLRIYWLDHQLLSPSLRERWANERHNQAVLNEVLDGSDRTSYRCGPWVRSPSDCSSPSTGVVFLSCTS